MSLGAFADTVGDVDLSQEMKRAAEVKRDSALPIDSCITSEYGIRTVKRMSKRGSHHHGGVDFRAPVGTPINSFQRGIVTEVGSNGKCGKYIEMKLDSGLYCLYCHLSSVDVKKDDKIEKGKLIAKSGQSGNSRNNPHLHFVIKKEQGLGKGSDVNPMFYLPPIDKCEEDLSSL